MPASITEKEPAVFSTVHRTIAVAATVALLLGATLVAPSAVSASPLHPATTRTSARPPAPKIPNWTTQGDPVEVVDESNTAAQNNAKILARASADLAPQLAALDVKVTDAPFSRYFVYDTDKTTVLFTLIRLHVESMGNSVPGYDSATSIVTATYTGVMPTPSSNYLSMNAWLFTYWDYPTKRGWQLTNTDGARIVSTKFHPVIEDNDFWRRTALSMLTDFGRVVFSIFGAGMMGEILPKDATDAQRQAAAAAAAAADLQLEDAAGALAGVEQLPLDAPLPAAGQVDANQMAAEIANQNPVPGNASWGAFFAKCMMAVVLAAVTNIMFQVTVALGPWAPR
jgi:hypothetical protein